MRPQEYVTMRAVEDWHWWYRSLRGLLKQQWNTFVACENPRFADIGCGTGANLACLETTGLRAGLDISRDAVAFCRERGLMATAVGSANALPYAGDAYDAVLSMDVLCHKAVSDREGALREVFRILRPGGVFLLNLPAYQWLHSSHDVAVETNWRPTARIVRKLLENNGFEPLRVTYWNTLFFPALATVRLLRKPWKHRTCGSDLRENASGTLNKALDAFLKAERTLMRYVNLPFGLSVFAVARKPFSC